MWGKVQVTVCKSIRFIVGIVNTEPIALTDKFNHGDWEISFLIVTQLWNDYGEDSDLQDLSAMWSNK